MGAAGPCSPRSASEAHVLKIRSNIHPHHSILNFRVRIMGRFKIWVRFRVKVSVKDRVRVDPSRCPMHDSPDHRKYDIYKMFICRQFYIFPPLSTVSSPETASFDAFEVFAEIALQFSSRIVEYSSVLL